MQLMKGNNDQQEVIDRYILGEMDENEITDFENQLADDAELRTETELTRQIISAIRKNGEQDAITAMQSVSKATVKKWITTPQQAALNNRRILYLRITTAAAAVILLFLYIGYRPRYSTEQLFAQYYLTPTFESYPVRGGFDLTSEERQWMRQAETNYREANYINALSFYNRLLSQQDDWKTLPEEVIFHCAICRIEIGDLTGAISFLEHIIADDKSLFYDEATFYVAFTYLKVGKRNKAKECLRQLIVSESEYMTSASKVLETLNEKKWF